MYTYQAWINFSGNHVHWWEMTQNVIWNQQWRQKRIIEAFTRVQFLDVCSWTGLFVILISICVQTSQQEGKHY